MKSSNPLIHWETSLKNQMVTVCKKVRSRMCFSLEYLRDEKCLDLTRVMNPNIPIPPPFSTSDSNTIMSTSQRYLLKWSVPLGHVEVIEYGSNDGAGENRCPPMHPPESLAVVANAKPSKCHFY